MGIGGRLSWHIVDGQWEGRSREVSEVIQLGVWHITLCTTSMRKLMVQVAENVMGVPLEVPPNLTQCTLLTFERLREGPRSCLLVCQYVPEKCQCIPNLAPRLKQPIVCAAQQHVHALQPTPCVYMAAVIHLQSTCTCTYLVPQAQVSRMLGQPSPTHAGCPTWCFMAVVLALCSGDQTMESCYEDFMKYGP